MRLFLISLAATTARAAAAPAATVDPAVEFTHCMEDRTAAMGSSVSLGIDEWKACAPGAAAPQPSSLQPTTMLATAATSLMDPGEGASQWIVDRLMTKWKKAACGNKCGADGVAGLGRYIVGDIEKSNKRGATIGLMQLESVRSAVSNIFVGAVEKSLKGSSSAFFDFDDFAEEMTQFSNNHNT